MIGKDENRYRITQTFEVRAIRNGAGEGRYAAKPLSTSLPCVWPLSICACAAGIEQLRDLFEDLVLARHVRRLVHAAREH